LTIRKPNDIQNVRVFFPDVLNVGLLAWMLLLEVNTSLPPDLEAPCVHARRGGVRGDHEHDDRDVGGRVTAQSKFKGAKRKAGEATSEHPAPTTKKGRLKATSSTTDEPASEPAASSDTTTETPPATTSAAPAPSRRGKKRGVDAPTSSEPASLNAITPGHDAKLPAEPPEPTLADLAAGYLAHLEASGKSEGTMFSYRLELAVAMSELGKDTPVRDLRAERVKAFFESERVTKTRSGSTKSPLSIDKTRRVLRQAIAWGAERGVVDAVLGPVQ
jgi:hypothetical protein